MSDDQGRKNDGERFERRQEDATVRELLSMMRSLNNDFQSQANLLLTVKKDIDVILAAFPSGGLVEHRMFHERQAIDYKDAREFRQSLKRGLALWGAIGVIPIIIYALWEYLKLKVHQ